MLPVHDTGLAAGIYGSTSMKHWLMKSEPTAFAIDDLMARPEGTDHWDGVRNYQARNFLRDEIREGDRVLFYHSGRMPAVVGTARVVRKGYPDPTALDPQSAHFDPKSTPDNPIWYLVDIRFETRFDDPLPLTELRKFSELAGMQLLKKGMRLSIQPVSRSEFDFIVALSKGK
jgi:predicted RNA-binding protein with PUA-like domain